MFDQIMYALGITSLVLYPLMILLLVMQHLLIKDKKTIKNLSALIKVEQDVVIKCLEDKLQAFKNLDDATKKYIVSLEEESESYQDYMTASMNLNEISDKLINVLKGRIKELEELIAAGNFKQTLTDAEQEFLRGK